MLLLAIFIIILIPTFLFSLIRTIVSMLAFLFTGKRRRTTSSAGRASGYYEQSSQNRERERSTSSHKKMFDRDEGEYVDFEEIKEDK